MPIKIDLLNEARDLEDERRRDPVRRVFWIAAFLVALVLIRMLQLALDIHYFENDYDTVERRSAEIFTRFAAVTNDLAKIGQIDSKLAALSRLTTNRFLWAPLLSALEKTTVRDIQVTRLAGSQTYDAGNNRNIGSDSSRGLVPEYVLESISLSIQGIDKSSDGQARNKYKEALNGSSYFSEKLKRRDGFLLQGVLRVPGSDNSPSGDFVTFVLSSEFPEIRRHE